MNKISLDLEGINSNAFAIIGAFRKQAKKEGWTAEEVDKVIKEAMAGDYNHLLQTIMEYCE
jgi:hypothetical protein